MDENNDITGDSSMVGNDTSLGLPLLRDEFYNWLSSGNNNKFTPEVCMSCIDKVSEYAIHKKICYISLWSIKKHSIFQPVYKRLLETKLLRISDKNTYNAFIVAGQLYLRFLKDKSWLKDVIDQTTTVNVSDDIKTDVLMVDNECMRNNSVDIKEVSAKMNPDDFVAWMTEQKNNRGTLYLERVARKYIQYLRSAPSKLEIPNTAHERDVFSVQTIEEFDRLSETFLTAHNFKQVNENGHQTFSAGLKVFRRYLKSLSEQGENLQEDEKLNMEEKIIVNLEQEKIDESSVFTQPSIRSKFREWLLEYNAAWSSNTLNMLCSDALYLYNNNRGITLIEALTDDEGIEKAYNALEKHFTSNPRQTGTASTAAKGYTDTLQLFKKFIKEQVPDLINSSVDTGSTSLLSALNDSVVPVLTKDYTYGFNFDSTSVRLLAEKSGIDLDTSIQNDLKKLMFCRTDSIYFWPDVVADFKTRQEIISYASKWLYHYGCFEISELYTIFVNYINKKAIRNLNDFESFYEFNSRREARCVAYYGTRIARVHNMSIRDLSIGIAKKVISIAHDEYGGTINEDDLRDRFPALSADLLDNIIKEHAEELVRTEINGIICYQTLDALGLSDEFSFILAEVLEQIDEVGLIPNEEVIHTALSIRLGVNFKSEYNIPDDKTYRRLISAYYNGESKRDWKRNIFAEVQD